MEHNQTKNNLRTACRGDGAWREGNDVDPALEDGFPSHGTICEAMEYFDFNPIQIERWNRLAKMDHPVSGTHYHDRWLGHPRGYRAVAISDHHLENEIVSLRELDRARTNSHVPFTPDGGSHYYARTFELGETSTDYDAHVLEREGVLGPHPIYNINPVAERHHPLVLLHATAREHFHALVVAALKTSGCCHKEHVLLGRVLN